jgi:uncharacterized membrane protein YoaK (UPF0700 family)
MSNRSKDIFVLIFIFLIGIFTVEILDKYQFNTPITPIILWLVVIIGICGIVRILIKYHSSNKT